MVARGKKPAGSERRPASSQNRVSARLGRSALPQVRAGFVRTHYFGRRFLNNKWIVPILKKLVRESIRSGEEANTKLFEDRGYLNIGTMALTGPDGRDPPRTIVPDRKSRINSPHRFYFNVHTHIKTAEFELEADRLSPKDLQNQAGKISCLIVIPTFSSKEKKLKLGFVLTRYPKGFDPASYEERVFQAMGGRALEITPQIQKKILQEMGAKYYSFDILCNRRLDGLKFDERRREEIIKNLL